MRRRRLSGVLAVAALAAVAWPAVAAAQWISPGELSRSHAELDGDRSCTLCHALRERGVQPRLCLECHVPLHRRIEAGEGYHASPEREDCGGCHREHFGREVEPVRFDTAAFRHEAEAGWPLRGAHASAGCRGCHRGELVQDRALAGFEGLPGFEDRTYLGLPTTCAGCHATDDPHAGQFSDRSCSDCHDEIDWSRTEGFTHDRTRYPLTGRHRDVACSGCHREDATPVRYTPLRFDGCDRCHADPHDGAMSGPCEGCHATTGWDGVAAGALEGRFRHAATRFPLEGRHARLECAACHRRAGRSTAALRIRIRRGTEGRTYPSPSGTTCRACHVDAHRGELDRSPIGGACEECHDSEAWTPAYYGIDRHNRSSAFPLAGAHAAIPCQDCHRNGDGELTLKLGSTACRSCHAEDDPHGDRFVRQPCDACHGTGSFRVSAPAHAALPGGCASCHSADDPHGGQFPGRECDACHGTESYRIPAFDHGPTGFVLDGAHARAACGTCHVSDPDGVVRWSGVPTECTACHGGSP